MSDTISFFVPGIPATKGSTHSMVSKSTGKIITMHNCKTLRPWTAAVRLAASDRFQCGITRDPVWLGLSFAFPRPKSHYGTGKNANKRKASAPGCHGKKPDIDKLIRAMLDAFTGVIYVDDAQVCRLDSSKLYDKTPGVSVRVVML